MKYFKNTELAKLYHVSEKSVRNWIEAAQAGKLDLQLHEENGKVHIANSTKNNQLIEELVEKGKKFKNSRGFKVVSPTPKFYETYNQKQILDIISNILIHHEIPMLYSYVHKEGADYWDEYAKRLNEEKTPNILNQTITLFEHAKDTLDCLLDGNQRINLIDLGPGNGLPVRTLLTRLIEQQRLNRYIAIDCSRAMLDILERNIKRWFGDAVPFEGHLRDFNYERFDDILCSDYARDEADVPSNLVTLLGGSSSNFRSPDLALQMINSSMGRRDVLIYAGYLDTPQTRRYFDFDTANANQKLEVEITIDLLGIDETMYSLEQTFDEAKRARSISFKPKIDLSIKIDFPNGARYIELRKNESILMWRHWHKNAVEIINSFDRSAFDIKQVTKSPENQYIMMASKIKTEG